MCIKLGDLEQSGGRLAFSGCSAPEGRGGGLHVLEGSVTVATGTMEFEKCSSGADGGGFAVKQSMKMSATKSKLLVIDCHASQQGAHQRKTACCGPV